MGKNMEKTQKTMVIHGDSSDFSWEKHGKNPEHSHRPSVTPGDSKICVGGALFSTARSWGSNPRTKTPRFLGPKTASTCFNDGKFCEEVATTRGSSLYFVLGTTRDLVFFCGEGLNACKLGCLLDG